MTTRYTNGIPAKHIGAAIGVQQADFDEDLPASSFSTDGSLHFMHDRFTFTQGGEIISGMDQHGSFRPKRFILTVTMGTAAAAGHNGPMDLIFTVDGTRVTIQFSGMALAASAADVFGNTVTAGGGTALGVNLPASVCPNATVYGTCCVVDNITPAIGTVQISALGVITITNGADPTPFTGGGAGFPVTVHPFSITYDTMKVW